jgi:hypothetical protein
LNSTKTSFVENNFSYQSTAGGKKASMISPTQNRGETILRNNINKSYHVKSKLLSNTMFNNIRELFMTTEAYTWINGYLYPIIIDTDKQEIFNNYNRVGDRPFYEFDFHLAVNETTMRN